MAAANDLRKGQAIRYNSDIYIVLEVTHRTPGNLRAFVQAIIRSIKTGKSSDVRFSSTEKVELVEVSRETLEFSYKDQEGYHFMDPKTYDDTVISEAMVGASKDYLTENLPVTVLYAEGKAVEIELPGSVTLRVTQSADGVRGDSANNVQVPLFIKEGEMVKISTTNGAYMGRA